jgi:hypothetical protein
LPTIKVSELLARFKAGATDKELGEYFGLNEATIHRRINNLMERSNADAIRKVNRKARQTKSASERDEKIVRDFHRGKLESEIARNNQVTRQRVEQVLYSMLGVEQTKALRVPRREDRERAKALNRFKARQEIKRMVLALGIKCRVCHKPIDRMLGDVPAKTCGGRCRKLWEVVRLRLDENERQKSIESLARSILKSERPGSEVKKSWAEKRLRGESTTYRLKERSERIMGALREVERLRNSLDRASNVA